MVISQSLYVDGLFVTVLCVDLIRPTFSTGFGHEHSFLGPIRGIQNQYILHFRGLMGKIRVGLGGLVVGVFFVGMLVIIVVRLVIVVVRLIIVVVRLVIVVVRLGIFKIVRSVLPSF